MLATYTNLDPLTVFIEANGVVEVTLEKLNRPICNDYPSKCSHEEDHTQELITPVTLTKSISSRLPELQDLTRAKLLMSAYSAAQMAIAAATMSLPGMSSFDKSKYATNLMSQVAVLTEKPKSQNNFNLNQMIFESLDDEARQAWLYLTKNGDKAQSTGEVEPPNTLIIEGQLT